MRLRPRHKTKQRNHGGEGRCEAVTELLLLLRMLLLQLHWKGMLQRRRKGAWRRRRVVLVRLLW